MHKAANLSSIAFLAFLLQLLAVSLFAYFYPFGVHSVAPLTSQLQAIFQGLSWQAEAFPANAKHNFYSVFAVALGYHLACVVTSVASVSKGRKQAITVIKVVFFSIFGFYFILFDRHTFLNFGNNYDANLEILIWAILAACISFVTLVTVSKNKTRNTEAL
jgi:hypothetical protein